MPSLKGRHAGSWKTGTPKGRHAGTWKTGKTLWGKQAGVWKEIWTASQPPIWTAATTAVRAGSGFVTASFQFTTAGAIVVQNGSDGSWLPSGAAAGDYRTKWVGVSGDIDFVTGLSQNTWYANSANRTISLTSNTTRTATIDITQEETATGASRTTRVILSIEPF